MVTRDQMIDLVARYFTAVDGGDFEAVAATLTDDCVFTVETHGVELTGLAEIEPMFRRLWANHMRVCHTDFVYVPDPESGQIAARFAVINTLHDGSKVHKSNCNFFQIRDGRFKRVAVYMAGENTLVGA